ncbi:hypothetical protein IC229_25795 [Spirosoma sp. BT702]|uniref:DUF11 domain-containing protein n=2 Tax=Spirosoma profusum TaxID=2771354 RepID=A0A927ATP8_9BACT|nr:hypothetical protein [Spirosoma profusum]
MIIQRNNANTAIVQIAGSYSQPVDSIEARLVARATGPNQGTTTSWMTVQRNPSNGQFNGTMSADGGWYKVMVRGKRNGSVVGIDSVDRFGIGEVFAIMGHSNAQGGSCPDGGGNERCPTIAGASDDRVSVVVLDESNPDFYQYELSVDTRYLPGLTFNQLPTFPGQSPFGHFAWFWGKMGDQLVQQLGVPVLFFNAGFGGTNMQQTYQAAYDQPFNHGFVKYSLRMPYANFRSLMNLYVPSTGIRAVLLHHGENDRFSPSDSLQTYYSGVITKTRQEFNKADLAYIIAISSWVGGTDAQVRYAQSQVANQSGFRTFQGPDLDNINSYNDRPDGLHYSPSGQEKVANAWANAITTSVLQSITPYSAETQPLANIACAPGNQLMLTQPGGFQDYFWNTGSTNQALTAGSGTYSARIRNAQQKVYFPPAITVPNDVQPATPTINGGTSGICSLTGLTLTSSYTGLNQWNTGASTQSITVVGTGVYSVQAKNPVYGCLSPIASRTVTLSGADLALSLGVSRMVVATNDTLTYTLTVRSESDCDAGGVTIRNRLPNNVTFVSSPDGLSVSNGVVTGVIPAVAARSKITKRYVARLTSNGTYLNAAEVQIQATSDPDSQPGTGTGDGQDDMAMAQVRTKPLNATAVYSSPNPGQPPLSDPIPNQPPPSPTKADLSLALQANKSVVSEGESLTFVLTVTNVGGIQTSSVAVGFTLPSSLSFVSSVSGMTVNGSTVSGTVAQLGVNKVAIFRFEAKALSAGPVINRAQITASAQSDPDSTPNNGTNRGEDDEARFDIRIVPSQ